MGKTSAKVKNRYIKKAYDRISLVVYKGEKETLKTHAEKHGESISGFIHRAIKETMDRDNAQ